MLMMGAEKRKRVMPRHLMTAMVQLGIIPIRVLEGIPDLRAKDKAIFNKLEM